VPDLKVTVEKMIVAGDYVTVHMHFAGHFTGKFGQTQGKGQPVPFIATRPRQDENGRITDNWHIEDNLTLLQRSDLAIYHACRSLVDFGDADLLQQRQIVLDVQLSVMRRFRS